MVTWLTPFGRCFRKLFLVTKAHLWQNHLACSGSFYFSGCKTASFHLSIQVLFETVWLWNGWPLQYWQALECQGIHTLKHCWVEWSSCSLASGQSCCIWVHRCCPRSLIFDHTVCPSKYRGRRCRWTDPSYRPSVSTGQYKAVLGCNIGPHWSANCVNPWRMNFFEQWTHLLC